MQVIIGLHVALWLFDSFSILPILVGIATHVAYYKLLHGFPFIELTSPIFLLSCGPWCTARASDCCGHAPPAAALLVIDHFVWIQFFGKTAYRITCDPLFRRTAF
jgi:hypothetical protein